MKPSEEALAGASAPASRGRPAVSARDAALAYVAAHPEPCRLTVDELVRAVGVSRATLYRAFQPHGGVNEFLMQVRLEAARKLLASGASVLEVSRRCGFKHTSHFSHRFRTAYGQTARAYGQENRTGAAVA